MESLSPPTTEAGSVPWRSAMAAGAFAGLMSDVTLFPLDSIKTRLQSKRGFFASGGFSKLYCGLGPMAFGSIPSSALFFVSYATLKHLENAALAQATSASIAELAACLIRVPTEVLKQRMQVDPKRNFSWIFAQTVRGSYLNLYRGFMATLMRDIPFAFIQFPVWEALKKRFGNGKWESALAGFISGGLAGFVTTPLDVVKTRVMTGDLRKSAISDLLSSRNLIGWTLFKGAVPRTAWLSIGGFVYLGSYELFFYYYHDKHKIN